MTSPISIRKLARQDVNVTARLLAESFADNPCYVFMHRNAAARAHDLEAFFKRNLLWHLDLEATWVAVEPAEGPNQGRIVGTVTLIPPGGAVGNPLGVLTHWVLPMLFQQGLQTVRRIISTDNEFKQRYLEDTLGLPYWHVHAVAVARHTQGLGVGTKMLRLVMKELQARVQTTPGPVVLSTQLERNLPFYRRIGFELTGMLQMGVRGGQGGYASWFMRHTTVVQNAPVASALR